MFNDLTIFRPERSFFVIDPEDTHVGRCPLYLITAKHRAQGVNCRFGNRGVIAEAHHDGGRNFIAIIKGEKRYILLPKSSAGTSTSMRRAILKVRAYIDVVNY